MSIKQKGTWRPGSVAAGNWEELGPVAPGGSVFDVAVLAAPRFTHIWAATSCGVFRHRGQGLWEQYLRGLSTPLVSALHIADGGTLLAGGMNGELFRSLDGGQTWERGTQLHAADLPPVTSIASSFNYLKDGTALAGTEGGGIWRSEDGGRRWLPANFGLEDQSVQALVCAPDWSREELTLAGTAEGLFRSTNGGRAWREVDWPFSDMAISALAVVAEAKGSGVFFAGSEEGYVYTSSDGGRRWTRLVAPSNGNPVNALYVLPGSEGKVLLAGTTEGVFLSENGGAAWKLACSDLGAVLSLTGAGQLVVAGSYDYGTWQSEDGGKTWTSLSQGMAARGLARLITGERAFFVLGPNEGLWRSGDLGSSWEKIETLNQHLPLSTFAVADTADGGQVLLVSSVMSGLLRSTDNGANWQVVQEGSDVLALLVAPQGAGDARAWAATATGEVLFSNDLGATWRSLATDAEGERALLLAASPHIAEDRTIFLGTSAEEGWRKQPTIHVWRSIDEGRTWRKVLDQHTGAQWLDAVLPPAPGRKPYDGAYFATETQCLRPLRGGHDVWVGTQVTAEGPNVLGLAVDGDPNHGGSLYAATSSGVFRSQDGGRTWQLFSSDSNSGSFVGVALGPDGSGGRALYVLELGGTLWRKSI
jgi:photosystem II stability/assembly factor-like uncharacterized protein